ncbi:MAG: GTPase HflX [Bdellovibrio sp. 28-41-41]|nr:MAG: GTPase HflX [Bdellovibrio sp. 28-41-41]
MQTPVKNAVLVGIQLPKISSSELQASLDELTRLVTTLGYSVIGQVTQKRASDRSASILGDGKLKELAQWTDGSGKIAAVVERKLSKAAEKWKQNKESDDESDEDAADDGFPELSSSNGDDSNRRLQLESEETEDDTLSSSSIPADKIGAADIVIVDTDLSPSQIRNLESATGVTVLDRTGVIIEIFSRHARTRAARLQVEIARLTYVAPRLRETGGGEDRGGGGVGGKGAGESALELDKRKIRDRIKELKIELASIGNEHEVRRARRQQEISVALVGYTNAGKSSLMRAMTGSEVLVADKLFATLDTTIRPLHPETRPKVLLSDTVGFIKKLPHDLVASFKSTLDEALNASLLLFVVDSSDPSFRSQLEVTQSVLGEVGANETPRLLILNKRDRLTPDQELSLKTEYPDAVMLSTRNKDDLKSLRDQIMSYFETDMQDEDIFVPYTAKGIIGEIRGKMKVLSESYDEKGVSLKVRSHAESIASIKKKITTTRS